MDFFDFVNISEEDQQLINPSTLKKLNTIGRFARLAEGKRVIEFGCGFAEVLVTWAGEFAVTGVGIDVREYACERAKKRLAECGLSDGIEIVCGKGHEYDFEKGSFDLAACIGSSFVFGGYRETIRAMKEAINEKGTLAIGEPYWLSSSPPSEYAEKEKGIHYEHELLAIAREEGFDVACVVRADHDDWDRYESIQWPACIRWLENNPAHPEREDFLKRFHEYQDNYFRHGREFMGWAMYVLDPVKY